VQHHLLALCCINQVFLWFQHSGLLLRIMDMHYACKHYKTGPLL
jgi:hypothetical protein